MTRLGEFETRHYQDRALTDIRAAVARLITQGQPPRVLVASPCGSGKTLLSSMLIAGALAKDKTSMFMAHGRQLIYQKSRTLHKAGINHAVLMAGVPDFWHSRVIVASKDTYEERDFRVDRDLWIIDEAHAAMSETWLGLIPQEAVVIGLTATPVLPDGTGMGGFYKALVRAATYEELIREKLIVPAKVFAPWSVDYRGLAKSGGDWSWEAVYERFKGLTGDVVEQWQRLGNGLPTACFASNVKHSIDLCRQFNHQGIPAVHIDADTPQEERDEAFEGISSGRIRVLCNFGVLTVGFDLPVLGCGILAYSTASLVKNLQVCGRLLRPFSGKIHARIIDHGDNIRRHGWPTEDHAWQLGDGESPAVVRKEHELGKPPRQPICCPKCAAMRESGPECPNCGHRHKRSGLRLKMQDGTLEEIHPKDTKERKAITDDQRLWMRCLGIAAHRDMTVMQARILFNRQASHYPPGTVHPLPGSSMWNVKVSKLYPNFVRRR